MPKFSRLRELSCAEYRVLLQALVLLPLVVGSLRVLGFRRTVGTLERWAPLSRRRLGQDYGGDHEDTMSRARTVGRLVAAAARRSPFRATCLPTSLTLGCLLRREGIENDLRLGVRNSDGRLEAHAWVEHEDVPIIDAQDGSVRFSAFSSDPLRGAGSR